MMQAEVLDRIPPQSIEAEMALIGSILVDAEVMDVAYDVVQASDFYAHVHETLFGVLRTLSERDAPIDKISVAEELRRRDALERVGGLSYLNALMDTVQTAASARYYATIVRQKSILRQLIHAGTEITQLGFEGAVDVEGTLDRAQQRVLTIGEQAWENEAIHAAQAGHDLMVRLQTGYQAGLTTGLRYIDEHIGGLRPGSTYILAARPAMGKTSLAVQWAVAGAEQAAAKALGRVLYFSLEMSEEELMATAIAGRAGIDRRVLRDGGLRDAQWEKFHRAYADLSAMPLYFQTGCTLVEQIRARARRARQKDGLALIVLDYLQLMSSSGKHNNRNDVITEVSRSLKVLAGELRVPIVILCQLNRNLEYRSDKRPVLADLRESGSIEQDADVVAFIHREGYFDSNADPYAAELIVAKQRTGPVGTVALRCVPEFTRFEDFDGILA
jgi:replicative DNA helicase